MYDLQTDNGDFKWYTSHKRVRAAKITAMVPPNEVFTPGGRVTYNPKGKPKPSLGWYIIGYEDGYISFSPPGAFESGYTAERPKAEHWKAEPLYTDSMDKDIAEGTAAAAAVPRVTLDQAKAIVETKTAPRITEEFLKRQITHATYYRHKHMTVCVLELTNGFFATGKAAPAAPENYDAAVGERYAYGDAFRQLWQLYGFWLRCELSPAIA